MAQTGSFIPKQSKARASRRVTKKIYIFSYVSYVVFFGTLLAVVGLFGFGFYLDDALKEQKSLLAKASDDFSQSDIARVRELESRLVAADQLLNSHAATSKLFTALEEITTQPVQYTNLTYTRDESDVIIVEAKGITKTFDALLFQRSLFKNAGLFKDSDIGSIEFGSGSEGLGSDTSETSSGVNQITFSVKKTLGPTDILYTASSSSEVDLSEFDMVDETFGEGLSGNDDSL